VAHPLDRRGPSRTPAVQARLEPVVVPRLALDPDPYVLTPEAIEPAPAALSGALRRIGPGMVLAASIVGSGELIATTTLGAQVGFSALWIILASCAIKPVVQGALGRYTIATGETGLDAFNRVRGPRVGVNWLVWAWMVMVALTLLQVGGMYGGVAQVLNLIVPVVPVNAWVGICLAVTLALLLGGGYDRIQWVALVKVGLFTVLTVCAAAVLVLRPGALGVDDVMTGLAFELPAAGLATAVAVFGITGVGATELVMYPYWCIEKGYARFAGPPDGSAARADRVRGWIRVMHVDIACSLLVYTLATVAFYCLGAGVLHQMGLVPAARDMIRVLSHIYTQTLGAWALWAFYAGAVVTLYGTIFASTAAHARVFSDAVRLVGVYPRTDARTRRFYRDVFTVILATIPALLYWTFESPVLMVVAGGVAQAMMLPLIGMAAAYLQHRHLPTDLAPSRWTRVALWIATGVMAAVAVYYLGSLAMRK
jgi:manganese transport protein